MANNDRKLRSDKKTETAVDTDSSNGAGVTTPPRPTSTGSQLSPLPNGKQVDPFIFDASDATFNSWIKPVCDQELSEEQFHDITADVETMLDTCFHLMKSKSSMTKEDWQKKAKIIEHRLIRIGCAIGYYDAHSVRLFFTRIHEAVDYHDASHAMLYKTKCVHTLAQMILHSHTKSSDTDSTQKKADRISKNKKAFYPDKLSNAADLFLFLQTLELECKRVPHWEAVVTFHDPNKVNCKLYNFFSFMNDSSIMNSMNTCKWLSNKKLKEGSLTLYMSTWSSLSKSLQKEMSVFKDCWCWYSPIQNKE